MRFTILAACTALAACATPPANQVTDANASGGTTATRPTAPPTGGPMNGREIRVACDAEPANFALDQPYSSELAERARTASGALTVRRLTPGQVVTMEYLESRLSLEVDAGNRVTGVVCG